MGKKKPSRDVNVSAFDAVRQLTHDPDEGKDPRQVESGRRGGQKGGVARKAALTPERRSEIAKKAAAARWKRTK